MGIHKFIRAIQNGEEITIYGDGHQTRDFTYVDDVVDANILAAKTNICGEVFNIGGGNRISVIELIQEIEEVTGTKTNIRIESFQKGDGQCI